MKTAIALAALLALTACQSKPNRPSVPSPSSGAVATLQRINASAYECWTQGQGVQSLWHHSRARHDRHAAHSHYPEGQAAVAAETGDHGDGQECADIRPACTVRPRPAHQLRRCPLGGRRHGLRGLKDKMTIRNSFPITPDLIAAHGLKPDEYERILGLIGREPTYTELGIFSAMWNEHCSYKSSKKWLKTLPVTGPRVLQGPGENAGVVDIGDGDCVVFKMESHNHPSYIEPYQGAATGVGGILRDVFTMGARPIAAMNALRFGEPGHAKTKHLVNGVVAGVGGYGNAFGVPVVGGEVEFDPSYNGNCLVNAFAAGLAKSNAIFLSIASGVGLPVVYLGAKTGRDGVGGATMASAEFDDSIEEKRPTVQVGDPFTEKCLLEACLELMASGAVIAIQDMGAAGLTCSAVEMGAKGDLGIRLDLDKVPVREENMTAYEMMLSESQERMLMVLRPEQEEEAEAIFRKWGLDFAIVGETTDDLRFRVMHQGEEVANLPIKELGDEAPEYDRPWIEPTRQAALAAIRHSGNGCRGRAFEACRLGQSIVPPLGLGAV